MTLLWDAYRKQKKNEHSLNMTMMQWGQVELIFHIPYEYTEAAQIAAINNSEVFIANDVYYLNNLDASCTRKLIAY